MFRDLFFEAGHYFFFSNDYSGLFYLFIEQLFDYQFFQHLCSDLLFVLLGKFRWQLRGLGSYFCKLLFNQCFQFAFGNKDSVDGNNNTIYSSFYRSFCGGICSIWGSFGNGVRLRGVSIALGGSLRFARQTADSKKE